MKLMRFDPFRELETLADRWNQVMQPFAAADPTEAMLAEWTPAVDIEETDGLYLIKADLPDVKKEDVKIGITDGVIAIEGERHKEKEEKGKKFHRVERLYGKFERRLSLPADVDQTKIAAAFKDGVLEVKMPKLASAKPRVDVKVA